MIEQLYLVILTFILLPSKGGFSITIIAAPVSLNTAIHSVSIPKNIRTNAANFIVMENQVRLGKSLPAITVHKRPKEQLALLALGLSWHREGKTFPT